MIKIESFAVGMLGCNCTVVWDEESKEAVVVDGGDGVERVVPFLNERGLRATHLVHTHAHIDHIGNVAGLRDQTGGAALLHPGDLPLYRALAMQASWLPMYETPKIIDLDGDLRDGQILSVGSARLTVLHTPGHTPGSVCFAIEGGEQRTILSGDTLFAGSIGRWDLGGTSMEDIVASIHRKLLDFPDDTRVIAGHGPDTTIGTERNTNPYLQ
ncbi:MAG TPA: MBL fold metallo-hydrolase [Candidatus Baltobacteraceae bacterium]|nr:MBL fold metallo-hydrolase [Candidatus Baltobacteraceae bacterium]